MSARASHPAPPVRAARRSGRGLAAAAVVGLGARGGAAQPPAPDTASPRPVVTGRSSALPAGAVPAPWPPVTPAMRWAAFRRQVGGPVFLLRTAAGAGIDQWGDRPSGWPQGATGYGRRAGSWAGRALVQASLQAGAAAVLLYDTRQRPSGAVGVVPRVAHALLEGVTDRTAGGRRVPSIPVLVGAAGGTAAQSAWEPPGGVDARFVARRTLTAVSFGVLVHVVREFRPRRPESQ